MGDSYISLGQPGNAIELHQGALELSTKSGDMVSIATAHGHLAIAYQARGDQQRALVSCVIFL